VLEASGRMGSNSQAWVEESRRTSTAEEGTGQEGSWTGDIELAEVVVVAMGILLCCLGTRVEISASIERLVREVAADLALDLGYQMDCTIPIGSSIVGHSWPFAVVTVLVTLVVQKTVQRSVAEVPQMWERRMD
jgi:hypothetical protein